MTACPDAGQPGETRYQRARRTIKAAAVFRTAADDALLEAQGAYDRWKAAESFAEAAEDEARRAEAALTGGDT